MNLKVKIMLFSKLNFQKVLKVNLCLYICIVNKINIMKNVKNLSVFNTVTIAVSSLLVGWASISMFFEGKNLEAISFAICSVLFILFIYWFNGKTQEVKPLASSFLTTYVSYTFLVVIASFTNVVFVEASYSFTDFWQLGALFLIYGYVFNIVISLVVYLLYRVIMVIVNDAEKNAED